MAKPTPNRFDATDAALILGLGLVTAGGWSVVGITSLVLPGCVLLWHFLPSRPPFFRDR
jgi:hypothetical protein